MPDWLTLPQKGTIMLYRTPKRDTHEERSENMRAKLQRLRKSNGYTQQTFSAAVGTSRSHYAQIETGDKQPALRLALRIKRVLNYYGDDIFDNTMPVGRK